MKSPVVVLTLLPDGSLLVSDIQESVEEWLREHKKQLTIKVETVGGGEEDVRFIGKGPEGGE